MKTYRGTRRLLAIFLAAIIACSSWASAHGASTHSPAKAKKLTIAFIQIGITENPFWADQARGAAEAGTRLGATVLNLSGQTKINIQIERMNDMINRHVDAIMIIPIDPKSILPALQRAERAHIPTLVLYSVSPHVTKLSGFDEYRSGHIVGVYSAQYLKQKFGSVKGNIAILKGSLGQTLDTTRTGGFTDVMKQYPGVKILAKEPTEWLANKATAIMQDWLVKYPNLTMVYGLSDTITVPALDVAKRSPNGKNIVFSSVDGAPIGITAVQQGQMITTAMYGPIYAGFRFAEMAVSMAKQYKRGVRHLPTELLHSALVTKANVSAASRATNLMSSKIHTFNFNHPLATILQNCQSAATCGQ